MLSYVARRLLVAVPTLIGAATVVFLMVRLLPGDPARVIAGLNATDEDVIRTRHQLGLDQSVPVQYLDFMVRLLHGDLGRSVRTGDPVIAEILGRLPYTTELVLASMVIAVLLGVGLGVLAAARHNSWLDLALSGGSVFGISMPTYWLGLMLILIFSVRFRLLPAAGANDSLGFILPSVTLALFSVGLVARQTRSAMLDVLREDYIRTARAKGLASAAVLVRHALRNALLPIVTTIGLQFGTLLGGAVLTETVFSWPGMGRLIVDSIFSRDYPVVQGTVLLLSVSFIVVNLITDLLYAYVDPRIRYS